MKLNEMAFQMGEYKEFNTKGPRKRTIKTPPIELGQLTRIEAHNLTKATGNKKRGN